MHPRLLFPLPSDQTPSAATYRVPKWAASGQCRDTARHQQRAKQYYKLCDPNNLPTNDPFKLEETSRRPNPHAAKLTLGLRDRLLHNLVNCRHTVVERE